MCFNLCSNSQTNCPNRTTRTVVTAIGPRGPVGPTGPVGPQGPQGPQGDAGLSNALYALTTNGTLTSGAIAPVAANVATPNNTTTVSGGVLTLQAGYYLVSFFVTGASATLSLSLNQNGAVVTSVLSTSDTTDTQSETVLVYLPTTQNLTLTNTDTAALPYTSIGITVVKLA